jgi:2-(1,2-epoxy-1,2-dihydrophenyl)acetyl-CoA isomerase
MAVEQQVTQEVVYEVEDQVACIRLNRPERMNAIGATARKQLRDAIRQAEGDAAARCLVLTGSGRAFSAGADVKEMAPGEDGIRTPEAVGKVLREEYLPALLAIRTMPKPVIAALNGVAAGIGASFAMAADLRIAVPEASIDEAFVRLGLVPDGGATWLLPRLVGTGKAVEMMMLGTSLSAEEGERLGIINKVVPAKEFDATVREWASRLASGPTMAIGAVKRAVAHAQLSSFEEAVEFESYLQEVQAAGDDFGEGVRAFVDKRPPRFNGR